MGTLEGKVALISGAARGQGAAHALKLAGEGADIIGVDIVADLETVPYSLATPQNLTDTQRGVEALGRKFVAVTADVRDRAALTRGVAEAIERAGRVDIVVATAGVCAAGKCWELSEKEWGTVLGTNLTGSWNLISAALPTMIEQGAGGSIIFTGSHAGFMGLGGLTHYTASKHALVGLTKSTALDLAEFGIRVNIVHPTSIDTAMFNYWLESDDTGETDDAKWEALNIMPVKSLPPNDVSEAVLFFASEKSRMISGSAITMGQRGS